MDSLTRRRVLGLVGGGLVAVAGCSGPPASDGDGATQSPTATGGSQATGASDGGGSQRATSTPELDLREANVVEVSVEAASDGGYRFDVTLYHDDDGEDGYANWWQVESTDGERLGRRELLHAHSTAPFTRAGTITVPDSVGCVVVRGHDQTHGYGGQAMVVALPSGETRSHRQGSERRPVPASACP
jgi:hypothetical protein